ncbi:hypothetical protein FRUB_10445 [Fimbriiglobus ruber]|uniref:Uncharacterized protein n=1 Tax=Fimbriiglobus ruber TaxID=1908690 RepID=A0A225D4A7_9BACT|nr:hypothetical protein FRUB_10445 [Fimbriiglobus ruber]
MAGAVPYRSAEDLVADLGRLAALFPCPPDAWERLIRHAGENATDSGGNSGPVRQSA